MQVRYSDKDGPGTPEWRLFLSRTTLFLSVILLGAGLVCGVAANWQALSFFQRLGAVQGLLVVAALGAAVSGFLHYRLQGARQNIPPALFCLATVVAGALLALVGQHYQTGADTYTLFLIWALLALPWALAARSRALWLMWAVLVNFALFLFLAERAGPRWGSSWAMGPWNWPQLTQTGYMLLAWPNLLMLAAWEFFDPALARARVGQRVLAGFAIAALTSAALGLFDFSPRSDLPAQGLWLILTVGLGCYYSLRRADRVILALLALGVMGVSLRWAAIWLMAVDAGLGAILGLALLLLAEAAIAARLLMRVEVPVGANAAGGTAHIAPVVAAPDAQVPAVPAPIPVWEGPLSDPAQAADPLERRRHAPALPAAPAAHAPWYVQTLLGLAAWLATVLLLLFIGLVNLHLSSVGAVGLAVVGCAIAVAIVRSGAGLFLRQVACAIGFGALGLAVFGGFDAWGMRNGAMLVLLLAAAVYVGAPDRLLRFLAAGMAAFSLTVLLWFGNRGADFRDAFDLLIGDTARTPWNLWLPTATVLAVIATAAFLAGPRLARVRQDALLPLAWAFALCAQAVVWRTGGVSVFALPALWHLAALATVLLMVCVCLPAIAALCLLYPRRASLTPALVWGVPLALVCLGLFWLPAPGIALALAWMLLGFGLGQPVLLGMGTLALLLYQYAYYQLLQVPLLEKALWLVGAAALLGVLRLLVWLVPRLATPAPKAVRTARQPRGRSDAARLAGAVAGLLLILGVVNTGVWQNERLLASGKTVLLALAPVDPRSLMQGDYMALNFDASAGVQHLVDEDAGGPEPKAAMTDGYAIFTLNTDGQARLLRIQRNAAPRAPQEVALRYRLRGNRVRLVTNAYFFPEGQAEHYAPAKYGELRVDDNGRGLLVGLRDGNGAPL
jgi:uncharacterized membrane-anchored protein/uncharacterized membrane protein